MSSIIEDQQLGWGKIFDGSGYCTKSLAEMVKLDESSFRKYLNCDRVPRATNHSKMEKAMKLASQLPRLQFHPSYGYATPDQIERLKTMKAGPDMNQLLKEIEE
jgi:hypothetical protein